MTETAVQTKRFHVGDILSITTGALVSPRHIDGVYDLLGWMVREQGEVMTHQLPRLSDECEPFLRETFPDLAEVVIKPGSITCEAELTTWLASLEPHYGTHRDVPRLPAVDHTLVHPIAEIKMLRPDLPIVGL